MHCSCSYIFHIESRRIWLWLNLLNSQPSDDFQESEPNSILSHLVAEKSAQWMPGTTEGTHFPMHAGMAAFTPRNMFRPKFIHNNANVRHSDPTNMASKSLCCLQIPQQISSRKQLDQDKRLCPQALKKTVFSNCPFAAFKTCMSPSSIHSLFSIYTLDQEIKSIFCALHNGNFILCIIFINQNEDH